MVEVTNLQRRRVSARRLQRTGAAALAALGRRDRDLHVTVVDDAAMRRLHQRYLGARRTTDVLAFDLAGPGPAAPLGEVIVSADQAARQAARLRIPLGLELDLLLVHGILHLVGYDDHDPREARLMHARAREILSGPAAAGRRSPDRLWTGLLDGR